MSSYYKRYCDGDCVGVWSELIALGSAVRCEPILSDAVSVAKEIVDRAYRNLCLLHPRLIDFGYEFASPQDALREANDEDRKLLNEVETEFGQMPIIFRAWYERIGSADFCQARSQLWLPKGEIKPATGPDIYGLGANPELVYLSLEECLQYRREMIEERAHAFAEAIKHGAKIDAVADNPRFLPIGGAASDCRPKGISLPNSDVDAAIRNDVGRESAPCHFVTELRAIFQWGGFPSWRILLTTPNFYHPANYRPQFGKLLPQLRQGFVVL